MQPAYDTNMNNSATDARFKFSHDICLSIIANITITTIIVRTHLISLLPT